MGHKAVIKCERSDAEWYFNDNREDIEKSKQSTIREKYRNSDYISNYRMFSYEKRTWKMYIEEHGIHSKLYATGNYTLWEGFVELDVLSENHFIYVEPLNQYLCINKVEINTDGTVTYYVNYNKLFLNLREDTRLGAIEEWLNIEYPHVQKFEELKNHKDDVNEYLVDYQRFEDGYYNPEIQKKLKQEDEKINIEKVEEIEVGEGSPEEITHEKSPQQKVKSMSIGDVLGITSIIFLVLFVVLMIAYFIIN